MNELVSHPSSTVSIDLPVARIAPSVADMLQAVIERGVTAENVTALDSLVKLYERVQERESEIKFSIALGRLQAETKNVKAIRPVIIQGQVRYMIAPYEDLMEEVRPHLETNGFSVSFSTSFSADRLNKTLRLQHCGGYSRMSDYSVKVSKPMTNREGRETLSEAQMESMASTTAKRGALCDALNIIVEKYQHDADARSEGGTISAEQAASLRARAQKCGVNEKALLKLAGAETFDGIRDAKAQLVEDFLTQRERPDPDPLTTLKKKLWRILEPVRGKDKSPAEAEAWLRGKKILPADVSLGQLTVDDIQIVIEKAEITLNEAV
jgi:hypothetical protein